jgi:hypothetical protein
VIACCALNSSHAQSTAASIELGTASMRYADSLTASAVSVSPALQFSNSRFALGGSGTFSRLAGSSTSSGVLSGTVIGPGFGGFVLEFEGTTGGSVHGDGSRTGQMLGMARARREGASSGVFVGAGLGRTSAGSWRSVSQVDAGGWVGSGRASLSLTLTPTSVDDSINFTDTFLSAHRAQSMVDLDASMGVRSGSQFPSLPADRKTWGSFALTWHVRPDVGIVASAGTYPVSLTEGFPGGRFLSVSVRLTPRQFQSPREIPMVLVTPSGPVVREFRTRRLSADTWVLRVRAASANSVQLMGDFSAWTPVGLRQEPGGWWSVTLRLASGAYELAVRTDGGEWSTPPGLIAARDEFGGTVGRLTIPK